MSDLSMRQVVELRTLLPDAIETWQVGRGAFESETDSRYIGQILSIPDNALGPGATGDREVDNARVIEWLKRNPHA